MRTTVATLAAFATFAWPAALVVGPGRLHTTIASGINAMLPLSEDLVVYAIVPTGSYATLQDVVPASSWGAYSVHVHAVRSLPRIVGYGEEDKVFEPDAGGDLTVAYENVAGPGGAEARMVGDQVVATYIKDRLGSIRITALGTGMVNEATIYNSYGGQTDLKASSSRSRERFTGKERDVDGIAGTRGIDLDYFGARYYDADLGMWISPDPARQFHSPYLYAGNGLNPVNFADANGLLLGRKAEADWLKEVCSDVPFGGSMSLANDWDELRNIPGQTFDYEIDATLVTAETYSTDDIRLPAGLSDFDFLRLFVHEASHTTVLKYREKYEALGWRSTKAPWHDDREVHKSKGGLWGIMEWNSTLPRVKGANGYEVWDPFYARDRIYYNEAGIGP